MRLLFLSPEEISEYIKQLDRECEGIKNSALKMSWYMRGGISYNDILNLSPKEREFVNKIIEDNMETTKNTKLPFF